ncbi:MAG: bifunctional folylpolyglutamate synthase/dihydrofolate synthase [Ruminococcaceae bacterium]|nr:bifunctional folylpolyglutamate synthase/dihydrofolate synthase [Oscillospiraceae bacterium]
MKYEDALSYIHNATRQGGHQGFGRVRRALELLGEPQKKLRFVHVAGTNGKGSTCTMTARVLQQAGYRTGLFISPYVIDFRERIQLNGEMIPRQELADAVEALIPVFDRVKREISECTEFELDVVLALYWFAKVGCDIVVLECGIGGREDKTNIIDPPEVAAVCTIAFDHMGSLGNTLASIAGHKGGIIKPGSSVVLYWDQPEEARAVLLDCCEKAGVTPNIPDPALLTVGETTIEGTDFTYKGRPYHVPLVGRHQVNNAMTVIAICEELSKRGFCVPYEAVRDGMNLTRFVGRCEVLRHDPLCIIDGAHNPDGAASLCRVIDEVLTGRRITAVMGMLEDKDYPDVIAMVARKVSRFIAVTPDSYRSLDAEKAAAVAAPHCADVTVIADPTDAIRHAIDTAAPDEVIIACGSLYLIGQIKETVLGDTKR